MSIKKAANFLLPEEIRRFPSLFFIVQEKPEFFLPVKKKKKKNAKKTFPVICNHYNYEEYLFNSLPGVFWGGALKDH